MNKIIHRIVHHKVNRPNLSEQAKQHFGNLIHWPHPRGTYLHFTATRNYHFMYEYQVSTSDATSASCQQLLDIIYSMKRYYFIISLKVRIAAINNVLRKYLLVLPDL